MHTEQRIPVHILRKVLHASSEFTGGRIYAVSACEGLTIFAVQSFARQT